MPRGTKERVDLEGALRAAVEASVAQQIGRLTRGRPLGDELRDLRAGLARIEKHLRTLDQKVGARPRRAGRGGSPGRPPLHTGCKVDGCQNEHYALGLCSKHYQQERRAALEKRAKAAARKRRKNKKA